MLWEWVAHSHNIHMIESLTIFTSLVVLIGPGLLACPFATGKTIAAIIAPALSYKVEYNKCCHKNEYNQHNFFPLVFYIFLRLFVLQTAVLRDFILQLYWRFL